jgi:hypothetical protein
MLDDPAILANILWILVMGLVLALTWWSLRAFWAGIKRRRRMAEPETHGDDGDRPPAPEIGSGLQAGDMEPDGWPAYGLKRLDGHKRGRVEVTGKGGK